MRECGYPAHWIEPITSYLGLAFDRLADYSSTICSWNSLGEKMRDTFRRFAFPMVWDFAEVIPHLENSGGYNGAIEWIGEFISHALKLPMPLLLQS